MPVMEMSQEGKTCMKKFSFKNHRTDKLGLDLLPIKPIIGRNTLNHNECDLQPLTSRHHPCRPYY